MTLRNILASATLFMATISVSSAANLIVNGNFEAPYPPANGFTSSYTDITGGTNTTEGQFAVDLNTSVKSYNNAWAIPGASPASSSPTQLMIVNGAPTPGVVVWASQPAIIIPETGTYFFGAYAANICCDIAQASNSPSILNFEINVNGGGWTNLDTITFSTATGVWELGETNVNLAMNDSVFLRLVNQQTALLGNDFVLDDIQLALESRNQIPEPSSFALFGIGIAAVALRLRRRK